MDKAIPCTNIYNFDKYFNKKEVKIALNVDTSRDW